MRYIERIPGLERAQALGAFVRLGAECEDFALNFNLGWILYDSIRTYAAVRVWPSLGESQISSAWIKDDCDRAQPLVEVLELSPEGAQATGYPEHRLILVFGPLSPQAREVRLEIQRLEPAGSGHTYFHPLIDPFAPYGDDQALHIMAWEEPDDPMAAIPLGTIAGCWAFHVDCPRHNGAWEEAQRYHLLQEVNVGGARLFLEYLDRGTTGWRLSCRFLSPANRQADGESLRELMWQYASPQALIEELAEGGLLAEFAPPRLQLTLPQGEEAESGVALEVESSLGPLGLLNNKFYYFFAPSELETPPRWLRVEKVIELPLNEPWYYPFDPKNIITPPVEVEAALPPCRVHLFLSLQGLYWESDMMLVAPKIEECADSQAWVEPADCLVRNLLNDEPYYCLGQSLVELPQPKYNLEREQVYGWQYPPLHNETRQARLEVCTINLTPHEPFSYPLAPTLADPSLDPQEWPAPEPLEEE